MVDFMDRVLSCGGLLRLCLYRSYSCTYNQNISKQKNPIQYYVALGIYMDALVCNAGTFWACGPLQVQNLSFMVSNIVSELLNHPCTLSALLGEDSLICAFCWPACSSARGRWLPPSSFLKGVSLERQMGNSSMQVAAVLER